MTNKRFTYHEFTRGIKDHTTKYLYEGNQETTDLLNKFYEQNQHLEGYLETYNKGCKELYEDKKRLEKELEQIKQNLKEAYENERTHLGKNVLKQLLETIQ